MRGAISVVLTAVVGCRPAAAPQIPVASCTHDRVGRVSIAGGTAEDVPQLAVLEGTLDDAARTERVRQASIDLLHTRGYPRAYIAVSRRPGPCLELDVAVVPGPRFVISAIDFVSSDAFPPAARRDAIEDALGTINAVGGAYVEDRLVAALAQLEKHYRAAGWLHAVIDAPVASFDEKRGTVRLSITVRAGKRT